MLEEMPAVNLFVIGAPELCPSNEDSGMTITYVSALEKQCRLDCHRSLARGLMYGLQGFDHHRCLC